MDKNGVELGFDTIAILILVVLVITILIIVYHSSISKLFESLASLIGD